MSGFGSLFSGGGFGGLVSSAGSVSSSSGGWASALGGSSSGGGWGSFFGNLASGLLGGGSGGSGGDGGNIWGQMLMGGLQGYASTKTQSALTKEQIQENGRQTRLNTAYEAQLVDFYKQRDKVRKRQALDTYGQFSTMNSFAPNATPAPPIEMPTYPQGGV
jgi:hypothetical protein